MADQPTLNPDQKAAFKAIQKFLDHAAANVFVLKGYAGTGKTFLMQLIAKWLQEKEKKFSMLAANGQTPGRWGDFFGRRIFGAKSKDFWTKDL